MRTRSAFFTGFLILLAITLTARIDTTTATSSEMNAVNPIYGVEMLWNNSMQTNDVAVSKDGKYLAAVNNTGLYYFASSNPAPRWSYNTSLTILSVAISATGEYVVAGNSTGCILYFNDSTTRIDRQLTSTWTSIDMGGFVERGTLDMSDNGEYVVLGGTGVNVWYFANCTARSTDSEHATWVDWLDSEISAVDMSSDGQYVAAGGYGSGNGFVAFYQDANQALGSATPSWRAYNSTPAPTVDVAVSDDGYAVASVGISFAGLHYWANATTLRGDPNATWITEGSFRRLDMSADGDSIVAAGVSLLSIHYWANARERQGLQPDTWMRLVDEDVLEAAISDDGSLIAASSQTLAPSYRAYFFTPDGSMLGNFTLNQRSPAISMSGTGGTTAVGGPGYDSLYVFGPITDSEPPDISDVHQQPANDSVHPEDAVMVFANVTDDLSGVQEVLLSFTSGNGTWFAYVMQNSHENQYNATIPPYPYCNTITYVIIAQDNANNAITTAQMGYTYQYHVIPELPQVLITPLFTIATLLAVLVYRKRKLKLR